MEFTYEGYISFLSLLRKNGYEIYGDYNDDECESGKKICVLRHDVDFSLDKAEEMAAIEKDNGISSVYFFMLTGNYYNSFSKRGCEIINNIRQFGHSIGLHFDETVYYGESDLTREEYIELIKREASMLEYTIGSEVKMVSMHEPSQRFLKMNLAIPGMINVYSDIFFQKYKYLSDSRMKWKENIEDVVKSNLYSRIQLLTHPFWYHKNELSRKDILKEFVSKGSSYRMSALMEYYPEING